MAQAFTVYSAVNPIETVQQARSVENPSVPLSALMDDGSDLGDAWFGGPRTGGVRVSRNKALGYPAIWRAVSLISGIVGKIPLNVYKSNGEEGRSIDRQHPAYRLFRKRPNAYMTPNVFKKTLQSHALYRGNGYAYIFRDADAQPTELLILDPESTSPFRRGGMLWYATEIDMGDGKKEIRKLPSQDVFHIPGLGYDGLVGYDVIKILSASIGKAIAARDFGARYFENDASVRTALEFPAGMKENIVDGVVNRWREMHQGLSKKHRTGVLREGVKLNVYSSNAKDSQLTENYTFDAKDIANVFGLPPHKVGDDSQSSYNSLEQENQALLDDTIDPWLIAWEEEADAKLLTEAEKETESHYCKFVRQALMRANLTSRGAYYVQALTNGWLNHDEVRDLEDYNPIPSNAGKVFYRPLNTSPSASTDTQPANNGPAADAGSMRSAMIGVVKATVGRLARRLEKQGKPGKDIESNCEPISNELTPVLAACRAVSDVESSLTGRDYATIMISSFRSDHSPGFEARAIAKITETLFGESQ